MVIAIVVAVQLFFSIIMGLYFLSALKGQRAGKNTLFKDSGRELEKIQALRLIKLTRPLTEVARPKEFSEIVGQEQGLKALRAALCGPNPRHVIIYGPPGVGKTAAARVALNEARQNKLSPFGSAAKFIEVDATIMRFDERNFADPLIGSVHDPIYQGAGAYGPAGVPQPKAGAVTKAHGGVLFIDEIGELHPLQMNKLLKVLEDGKVFLESAYYSENDRNIPRHVHDIFKNGFPADFRLVGATTRCPGELPPALRSRCAEVYFRPLSHGNVAKIALIAAAKGGFSLSAETPEAVAAYAQNGRDAVNIIQTAGSIIQSEGRERIEAGDVQWVADAGRYAPRITRKVSGAYNIGRVSGLAIAGLDAGLVLDVEAVVRKNRGGAGIAVNGAVLEEETTIGAKTLKRTGTAKAAADNALCALGEFLPFDLKAFDITINFPGGFPVDGPSAGAAIFCALYSAIEKKPVSDALAFTGEISASGRVLAVGGVAQKMAAAAEAGVKKVFIPKDNYQKQFSALPFEVVAIGGADELLRHVFGAPLPKISSILPSLALGAKGRVIDS